MKKLLLLSVLFSSLIFACKKDSPSPDQAVKNSLVGKWNQTQTSVEVPLGSPEVISPSSGVTYEFFANGDLIITSNGSSQTFSWSNLDNSTIKYSNPTSDFIYTIVQVDATSLKFSYIYYQNGVEGKKYKYFTKLP